VVFSGAVAGTPMCRWSARAGGGGFHSGGGFKQVGSMVADWSQAELAARRWRRLCAIRPRGGVRTLLALDPVLFIRETIIQAARVRRTTYSIHDTGGA